MSKEKTPAQIATELQWSHAQSSVETCNKTGEADFTLTKDRRSVRVIFQEPYDLGEVWAPAEQRVYLIQQFYDGWEARLTADVRKPARKRNQYNFPKLKRTRKALTRFWLAFFVSNDGHCVLCGNTGLIDTTHTAITAGGFRVGRRGCRICPNGMAIRFLGE